MRIPNWWVQLFRYISFISAAILCHTNSKSFGCLVLSKNHLKSLCIKLNLLHGEITAFACNHLVYPRLWIYTNKFIITFDYDYTVLRSVSSKNLETIYCAPYARQSY